ncbi:MAG: helix-turn-helix domain-containing protein [Clostridia bacterium]|nr:helix-turn-helix domain-containing protein [Clostridia bacterium]
MLSQRLKAARKACKLTQSQVAEILGIDRSAYTYYETGKTSPSFANLLRLSSVFKVDASWLLGGSAAEAETGFLADGEDVFAVYQAISQSGMSELSKEERQLVAYYRAMKGEGKGQALLEAFRRVRDSDPPAEDGNDDG